MFNFGRWPEWLYVWEADTSNPESHIPVAQQVEELKQEVEKEKSLLKTLEDLVYRIPGKDIQWRKEIMEEFSNGSDLVLRKTIEKIKEKYGDTLLITPASKEPIESVVYEESDNSGDAPIGGSELPGDEWDEMTFIDPQQANRSGDMPIPSPSPVVKPKPEQAIVWAYPTKRPEKTTESVVYEESDSSGDAPIGGSELPGDQDIPHSKVPQSVLSTEGTPEVIDKEIQHTVVKWQSLWRIVQAYFPDIESSDAINEKIDQIAKDNNIENRDSLKVGQKLKISWVAPVQEAQSEDVVFTKYRVQRGDTLWKIVQLHFPELKGTDEIHAMIDKIAIKNSIKNKNQISIGQILQIPM